MISPAVEVRLKLRNSSQWCAPVRIAEMLFDDLTPGSIAAPPASTPGFGSDASAAADHHVVVLRSALVAQHEGTDVGAPEPTYDVTRRRIERNLRVSVAGTAMVAALTSDAV